MGNVMLSGRDGHLLWILCVCVWEKDYRGCSLQEPTTIFSANSQTNTPRCCYGPFSLRLMSSDAHSTNWTCQVCSSRFWIHPGSSLQSAHWQSAVRWQFGDSVCDRCRFACMSVLSVGCAWCWAAPLTPLCVPFCRPQSSHTDSLFSGFPFTPLTSSSLPSSVSVFACSPTLTVVVDPAVCSHSAPTSPTCSLLVLLTCVVSICTKALPEEIGRELPKGNAACGVAVPRPRWLWCVSWRACSLLWSCDVLHMTSLPLCRTSSSQFSFVFKPSCRVVVDWFLALLFSRLVPRTSWQTRPPNSTSCSSFLWRRCSASVFCPFSATTCGL